MTGPITLRFDQAQRGNNQYKTPHKYSDAKLHLCVGRCRPEFNIPNIKSLGFNLRVISPQNPQTFRKLRHELDMTQVSSLSMCLLAAKWFSSINTPLMRSTCHMLRPPQRVGGTPDAWCYCHTRNCHFHICLNPPVCHTSTEVLRTEERRGVDKQPQTQEENNSKLLKSTNTFALF